MAELQAFFGKDPIPQNELRRRINEKDVSQDDFGLQQLAEEGSWLAVLALAEKLEREQIDAETKSKNVEKSLRYVLVKVTAYVKMGEHDKGLQVIERLGDLHKGHYLAKNTGRTVAPFSLLFLHAILPAYASAAARFPELALSRLNDLCTYCERYEKEPGQSAKEVLAWRNRIKRCHRALVSVYFDLRQYSHAVQTMRALIDVETNEAREMVLLQQFGCFCLRCGNVFMAMEAFRQLDTFAIDADQHDELTFSSLKALKETMSLMNRAFLKVSAGKFAEARELFEAVVLDKARKTERTPSRIEEIQWIDAMQDKLAHCAHGSMFVCHPFVATPNNDADRKYTVVATLQQIEGYVKKYPKQALALDATVYNVSLLYNLEGDEGRNKVALLHHMVECFRCSQDAAPKMSNGK